MHFLQRLYFSEVAAYRFFLNIVLWTGFPFAPIDFTFGSTGIIAAKNCFDYLECGGYLRVAVPDLNFKNEWYQNMIKIGGNGDPIHPAYTHKIVYDYILIKEVFERADFIVDLLEYSLQLDC